MNRDAYISILGITILLYPYLVGLTVPEHAEFAVCHDLHTVTLYGCRIEVLVRHHILRVRGAGGVRSYLADLVDDFLAGGVHVPADQAIITRCYAHRGMWLLHRARHLLVFHYCRGYHGSRISHFSEKRKRSHILISCQDRQLFRCLYIREQFQSRKIRGFSLNNEHATHVNINAKTMIYDANAGRQR